MTFSVSLSLQETMGSLTSLVASKTAQWGGRVVTYWGSLTTYLQDPRFGSAAIFSINFAFLEVAFRLKNLLSVLFPGRSPEEEWLIRVVGLYPLTAGIVAGANIAFIKATKINLHPAVSAALVLAAFTMRAELEGYIEK